MIEEIVDDCKMKRLTNEELQKMSTQRLLAKLKGVRKSTFRYNDRILDGDCGFYVDTYNWYWKYYNDIKEVLATRPHHPRKK
jgi:hypothetical protein